MNVNKFVMYHLRKRLSLEAIFNLKIELRVFGMHSG